MDRTENNVIRGKVHSVSVSETKGTKKAPVERINLVVGHGIEGDAHAGPWHRQVSILALESINRMRAKGFDVGPGDFAENIATTGVNWPELPVGSMIEIAGSLLEMTQIGKQCHAECAIGKEIGDCVMPREGVFAKVLREGVVKAGDEVVVRLAGTEDKRALRHRALEARRSLSRDEVVAKSRRISRRLAHLAAYRNARTVLFYVSSKDNEVDTTAPIERAIRKGKTVLVPISNLETRGLSWSELRSLDELERATFGILEPRAECRRVRDPQQGDLVIVPGVAFDPSCGRIGYGGGFYDRFLSSFDGAKVALAFEAQLLPHVPVGEHDIPVDMVITEDAVYRR